LFLGALTITVGVLAFFILGTPREVRWLSEDEKRAASLRTMRNKTGSDREKRSEFKMEQVWTTFKGEQDEHMSFEKTATGQYRAIRCSADPQTYFFSFMSIINALPNGANTTFAKLIWQSFGFTPLETLLKGSTPYYCVSICWFLTVGVITYKKPGLRCEYLFHKLRYQTDRCQLLWQCFHSSQPSPECSRWPCFRRTS
jgi:ACS family allantoate permease-like MFS transporter